MGKKKKLGLILFVALVASVVVYVLYLSEYQQSVARLEPVCAELTKNNPEGRVYEPIVGRVFGVKSATMRAHLAHASRDDSFFFDTTIILKKFGIETAVVFGGKGEKDYEALNAHLKAVVGADFLKERSEIRGEFGVCVFKNKAGKHMGAYETLRQIGGVSITSFQQPQQ